MNDEKKQRHLEKVSELLSLQTKPDAKEHVGDIMPRLLSERSTRDVLSDAVNKVSYLYEMIANSITLEEINGMSTKDKVLALQKLSHAHDVVNKNLKLQKPTFNIINVKSASKEELEAAVMNVNNE